MLSAQRLAAAILRKKTASTLYSRALPSQPSSAPSLFGICSNSTLSPSSSRFYHAVCASRAMATKSTSTLANALRIYRVPQQNQHISTYSAPTYSNYQRRYMGVDLGPKKMPNEKPTRTAPLLVRLLGFGGGVAGLGKLTPFVIALLAAGVAVATTDAGQDAIVEKPTFQTPEAEKLWHDNVIRLLALMPTRLGSQVWGYLTHLTLPVPLRDPLYGFYAKLFDVIMEEVPRPLSEFNSLNDFFTRRISMDHRPLAKSDIVSPVDGKVLVYGDCDGKWSEQIKGIHYGLDSLLGHDVNEMIHRYAKKKAANGALPNLKYCVIYLAPGDYHGIHSPVDWTIKDVRHFTGHLFSVSPATSARLHGLLSVNERVCLSGTYPHGFFSMTPVGAYNVGSITLEWDDEFNTNLREHKTNQYYELDYESDIHAGKGECVSFFNLGSTVVLIFEAPDNWSWKVNMNGAKIKLGEALCGQ